MSEIQVTCLVVLWLILFNIDLFYFAPEADLDRRSPTTWVIWGAFIIIVVLPLAALLIGLIAGCFGAFG